MGPFGLLWVGLLTFLMSAKDAKAMGEGVNRLSAAGYGLANIFFIWLHLAWGPKVYVWAKKAPLPKDDSDEPDAAETEPAASFVDEEGVSDSEL